MRTGMSQRPGINRTIQRRANGFHPETVNIVTLGDAHMFAAQQQFLNTAVVAQNGLFSRKELIQRAWHTNERGNALIHNGSGDLVIVIIMGAAHGKMGHFKHFQ